MNKTIIHELQVAFSKHSQPVWFRITKYVLLGCIIYFFWGSRLLWIILLILLFISLLMHFWYRKKTKGWTQSYGMWKHDKSTGTENSQ